MAHEFDPNIYIEMRMEAAIADSLGSPPYLAEARTDCIDACEKCDRYAQYIDNAEKAREDGQIYSEVVYRILVQESQRALAVYRAALERFKEEF